jgi:N1-aminopropylagmatine ureohydrolase
MFEALPEKDNFLGLEEKYSSFRDSKITILPCPYERTTSYGKGTSQGPDAILKSSHYVEFFDEETKKEICFKEGICAVKPLSFENLSDEKSLELIYKSIKSLIKEKKFVVTLGGEHTISAAIIRAYFENHKNLSVLQFDAHSDLRNEYEGTKFSHACFAARVAEFTTNITQVGIRALSKEEYDFIKKKKINTFFAHDIRQEVFNKKFIDSIIETLNKNIYITFDVDYFDPSIMQSTGTPEPNGFYWHETMSLLKRVIKKRNLVGFDVVELSPRNEPTFPNYLAAKLVYKMINYRFQ